jgi:hypothetical protein
MLRNRAALAAVTAAAVAAVGGSLGAAQAASTGTTGTTGATGATVAAPVASITVNGAGFATIDASAPAAMFHTDYLAALSDALADAKAKATGLATQSGDTLGAMTAITEQTNDGMSCNGPIMFAEGRAKGAPSVAPSAHHKPKPKKKAAARIADAAPTSCTIEADVTVSYAAS